VEKKRVAENGDEEKGQGLAFVFALLEEARGVLKAGDWHRVASSASLATYRGQLGGISVILAISGMGKERAEATTHELIGEYHPETIVSLGFAGGLTSGGAAGDMVVAETLMPVEGTPLTGESTATDARLVQASLQVLADKDIPAQSGICLTTAYIAANPEDKALLGEATGALAVEMESYWIGLICKKSNVPYLVVRSIIDTVDHQLPAYVVRYAHKVGGKSRWRQALPVLLRPWWIPGLLRLSTASKQSQASLTVFTLAFAESYAQQSVASNVVSQDK